MKMLIAGLLFTLSLNAIARDRLEFKCGAIKAKPLDAFSFEDKKMYGIGEFILSDEFPTVHFLINYQQVELFKNTSQLDSLGSRKDLKGKTFLSVSLELDEENRVSNKVTLHNHKIKTDSLDDFDTDLDFLTMNVFEDHKIVHYDAKNAILIYCVLK